MLYRLLGRYTMPQAQEILKNVAHTTRNKTRTSNHN